MNKERARRIKLSKQAHCRMNKRHLADFMIALSDPANWQPLGDFSGSVMLSDESMGTWLEAINEVR